MVDNSKPIANDIWSRIIIRGLDAHKTNKAPQILKKSKYNMVTFRPNVSFQYIPPMALKIVLVAVK